MRWTSTRSIKETFVPPKDYRYPHMERERSSEASARG
jgi:1-pyrroline-5-carboxylate dehydrogenase